MKRTISFLSVVYLTVLTACNQESTGTNTESSSAVIVVNGTEDYIIVKDKDHKSQLMKKVVQKRWVLSNLTTLYFRKYVLYERVTYMEI